MSKFSSDEIKQDFNLEQCVKNIDGGDYFTKEEISELYETFTSVDKDSNGTIDLSELKLCLSLVGMKLRDEQVREVMEEVDTDNSGDIDFQEFIRLLASRASDSSEEEDLRIAFDNFDRNHSHYIEAEDLKALLLSLGERVNDSDAAEMIRMADLDGDGKVSFEDYFNFIRKI
ncbi:calmodulin-A-like [Symsagittifera roscoffensis]|uniref:calmodulin-A-like n=1 Tax=Symsagittifera roscoffensis TaxID=84072 RepID=UPI00307BAFC4